MGLPPGISQAMMPGMGLEMAGKGGGVAAPEAQPDASNSVTKSDVEPPLPQRLRVAAEHGVVHEQGQLALHVARPPSGR